MSVVTVQIGQCGNQLGSSLFGALHDHACGNEDRYKGRKQVSSNPLENLSPDRWTDKGASAIERSCRRCFFRQDSSIARAVVIDTEPKAIQQVIAGKESVTRGTWDYDAGTQVCCHAQGGAANNWAYGYHEHGAAYAETCMEALRSEVERCDRLAGVVMLHSAAGGTGSGLGTYLTEAVRDTLPSSFILNTVVCASTSGEVILQNYNTLFAFSKLLGCSDGILVVENELATKVCQKLLRIGRPSHADLNRVICSGLAAALAPALRRHDTDEAGGASGGPVHLAEKLAFLCPNKDFMFLRSSMIPQMPDTSRAFTRNSWEALTRRGYQVHITGQTADMELDWRRKAEHGKGASVGLNQSVAAMLTYHGDPGDPPPLDPADCFRDEALYPDWSPTPFLECTSSLRLCGHDRSVSLVSNSQAVLDVLRPAFKRSRSMFDAGAYVHQYKKFGTESEHFEEAFLAIEQVIQNYSSLG